MRALFLMLAAAVSMTTFNASAEVVNSSVVAQNEDLNLVSYDESFFFAEVACVVRDARGIRFEGVGANGAIARSRAFAKCRATSVVCVLQGCRTNP